MHYNVVPIKSLIKGKNRLNSFLTSQERRNLILALLKDVLSASTNANLSDKTILITPDPEIISITKEWNLSKIESLLEPNAQGTNMAVQFAINWCKAHDASSILIIPADIPLITSKEIDKLLQLGKSEFAIMLAPSQRRDGTNAFYQRPPDLVQVWYGANSFQKNLELVSQLKIPFKIIENPVFALDIDLKEDLEKLRSINATSATSQFIQTLHF